MKLLILAFVSLPAFADETVIDTPNSSVNVTTGVTGYVLPGAPTLTLRSDGSNSMEIAPNVQLNSDGSTSTFYLPNVESRSTGETVYHVPVMQEPQR